MQPEAVSVSGEDRSGAEVQFSWNLVWDSQVEKAEISITSGKDTQKLTTFPAHLKDCFVQAMWGGIELPSPVFYNPAI